VNRLKVKPCGTKAESNILFNLSVEQLYHPSHTSAYRTVNSKKIRDDR